MSSSACQTIDSLLLGGTPDATKPSTFVKQLLAASHHLAMAVHALPRGEDYNCIMSNPTAKDVHIALKLTKDNVADQIAALSATMSRNLSKYSFQHTIRPEDHFLLVKTAIGDALEHSDMQLRLVNKYKRNDHNLTITQGGAVLSDSFSIPVSNTLTRHQLKRMKDRPDQRGVGAAPTKPQIIYGHHVDNSYKPFRPVIRHKPNAITPLDPSILSGSLPTTQTGYPHPYKEEILNFEYQLSQVQPSDVPHFADLKSTPCYWIDTHEDLLSLERYLKQQKMFAIDLEHHSQHTYQGITCLVQISTEQQDFIVDALVLRDQLSILNSSFTDPTIVKVLHGCNMDVIWLQRDLGLYLVNIFDTSQAARVLQFQRHNLASLLDHYCHITADKKYQLADWRQRPLNREMLTYAREDTHYLLHIYHKIKNELIDRSLSLSAKHPNIEQIYSQEIVLKVGGFGYCTSSNTPEKLPQHHLGNTFMADSNSDSSNSPTLNSTFKVPFLLAVVLSRSNKVPLTQYEKPNRPVLAARKLYAKLRFHQSATPQPSSFVPQQQQQQQHTQFTTKDANTSSTSLFSSTDQLLDDSSTMRLFCAIYAWRDQKARELDEAPGMLLKNDYIISILQNTPTTLEQLTERLKRTNTLLRPLIVPLFHLIQAIIQLPSELYNLDFSKLKFSLDPIKDFSAISAATTTASTVTTTNMNTNSASELPTLYPPTSLDNDGPTFFLSSSSTAVPATTAMGDDVHQSNIATILDPTVGLSHNSTIAAQRTAASTQVTAPSSTNVKDGKDSSGKDKKKKQRGGQKDVSNTMSDELLITDPTSSSAVANTTGSTWGDDTIAQLEQQIYQHYDSARYSHPLYFLPDYLHSIVNKDWKLSSEGISDNLEQDPLKLAASAGWGGDLPEFPIQREKLSRLNYHSAAQVVRFALGLNQLENNEQLFSSASPSSSTVQFATDLSNPATNHGVPLFDRDSIGKEYSDLRTTNSNTNTTTMSITTPLTISSRNTAGANSSVITPVIKIHPLITERAQQQNQQLVHDIIATECTPDKCNLNFTTPIKFDPTKQLSSQTSAFLHLYTSQHPSTLPRDDNNVFMEVNSMSDSISHININNPVASLESYGTGSSSPSHLLSPPRQFGNSSTHSSIDSPSQVKDNLVGGKITQILLTQPHSLNWDTQQDELVNGTPQISRAMNALAHPRRLIKQSTTAEISKFSLDHPKNNNNEGNCNTMDDYDDDEDCGDDQRIPDLKKHDMESIPSQLQYIYKMSNTKKSARTKGIGDVADSTTIDLSTNSNSTSTDPTPSSAANPFNPSQMLLGAEIFKTTTAINDATFLAKTGYTLFNKDQLKSSNDEANSDFIDDSAQNAAKDKRTRTHNPVKRQQPQQESATPSIDNDNPFMTSITNNPFLKDKNEITDELGTVYNPRGLKADHKDKNRKKK